MRRVKKDRHFDVDRYTDLDRETGERMKRVE